MVSQTEKDRRPDGRSSSSLDTCQPHGLQVRVRLYYMGWIGVDFDKTLSEHFHGQAWDSPDDKEIVQKPVWLMCNRVKNWLEEGKDVRIVTARAAKNIGGEDGIPDLDKHAVKKIQDWCEKYVGARLPVQFWKDRDMDELWDDKAVQVFPNTGVSLETFVWRP